MYKICSKCKIEKDINLFNKNKAQTCGYDNQCKVCTKLSRLIKREDRIKYLKEWRQNNPDARKEHYIQNKEHCANYAKDYRKANINKLRANSKKWQKDNLDKDAAKTAKRRAAKLQALPKWLTKEELEQIKELYTCAQMFKLYTGEEYHVDHIVPLQGENVCGLHVPWNLQVIPAKENLSKSNKLQEDTQ